MTVKAALRRAGYTIPDAYKEFLELYGEEESPNYRSFREFLTGQRHAVRFDDVMRIGIFMENRTELTMMQAINQIIKPSKYEGRKKDLYGEGASSQGG